MNRQLINIVFLTGLVLQVHALPACPTFWTAYGDHCYRYFGVHTTWREAEKICTGLGQAHLVSVHSKAEFDFVYQMWYDLRDDVPSHIFPMQGLWIGLTDEDHEGTFTYTDGSPMDYNGFAHGEPNGLNNEHYVHYKDVEGKPPFWNDALNEMEFQVMCKRSC